MTSCERPRLGITPLIHTTPGITLPAPCSRGDTGSSICAFIAGLPSTFRALIQRSSALRSSANRSRFRASNLCDLAPYVEGMPKFGYDVSLAPWTGLTLLVCTILYAIPRTAVLGAILLAGYLGGGVAAQLRVRDSWFGFPAVMGALAWAGLWCRSPSPARAAAARELAVSSAGRCP